MFVVSHRQRSNLCIIVVSKVQIACSICFLPGCSFPHLCPILRHWMFDMGWGFASIADFIVFFIYFCAWTLYENTSALSAWFFSTFCFSPCSVRARCIGFVASAAFVAALCCGMSHVPSHPFYVICFCACLLLWLLYSLCCRDFTNPVLPWGDPEWPMINALLPSGPDGGGNVLTINFDNMTYPVNVDGLHTVSSLNRC